MIESIPQKIIEKEMLKIKPSRYRHSSPYTSLIRLIQKGKKSRSWKCRQMSWIENNDITSLIKKDKTLFDSTWLLKSGAPDGRYYIFSLLYWNKMIRTCSYLRWFLIIIKKYYDTYLSQHSRKQQITWNSKRSKKDEQAKSKKKGQTSWPTYWEDTSFCAWISILFN
jgi:dTDP-glucose pyrophosphorylase